MVGVIENRQGPKHSRIINSDRDIAIVMTCDARLSDDIVKSIGDRLASIHYIWPDTKPKTKSGAIPIRQLRAGWQRVQQELDCFLPNVKRVLVLDDQNVTCNVIMSDLSYKGHRVNIHDAHGTLFKLGERVIVPTWMTITPYMKAWRDRDVARLLRLPRPDAPLPFVTKLPDSLNGTVIIDLEATGLDPMIDTITALGVQWSDSDRAVITGDEHILQCLCKLTSWLESGAITEMVLHNAQFDLGFLPITFSDAVYGKLRDTMLRARSRGETVATLKHLCNLYTRSPGNYAWHEVGSKTDYDNPAYLCEDIDVTWRLYKLWRNETTPVVEIMEKAAVMMRLQSYYGAAVDVNALNTLEEKGREHVGELHKELSIKYGCDPNSLDQLIPALQGMGYSFGKQTKKGSIALDAEVLEENNLYDLLELRKAQKLDSSFIGKMKSLLRTNGIMPHVQTLMAAKTGRTSMRDFNWQQLPRQGPAKTLLVSRFEGGEIAQFDLSQAELRVIALLANDTDMIEWLMGEDAHRVNAANAFGKRKEDVTDEERTAAKTLVFRICYGGMAVTEQQKIVQAYLKSKFTKLFEYMEAIGRIATQQLEVTDLFGKVTSLEETATQRGKWAVRRGGINFPVQGLASHISIWLTNRVWELLRSNKLKSLVLMGIHDSTLMDIYPGEKQAVIDCVKQAFAELIDSTPLSKLRYIRLLPFTGDLQFSGPGGSWASTKKSEVITCSSLAA